MTRHQRKVARRVFKALCVASLIALYLLANASDCGGVDDTTIWIGLMILGPLAGVSAYLGGLMS